MSLKLSTLPFRDSRLGLGALGSALLGETAEEHLLVLWGGNGQLGNNLSSAVDTLGDAVAVDEKAGVGVLLKGLSTVDHLVSGHNSEDRLGLLLLALLINNDLLGALDGANGGSAGGTVEVSLGQRVVGPLVVVELFEEGIVSLGEGPNNAVRSSHFYTQCLSIIFNLGRESRQPRKHVHTQSARACFD